MKKIFGLVLSLVVLFSAQVVFAETITHFNSNIKINDDATVDVVENISYDFGELKRHGIYRDIPVKYDIDLGVKYTAKIDDIEVVDEKGNNVTFDLMKEGHNQRIKIGSASHFVTGKHKYKISYTVHDAITYFDDHQEFYWNVTGNDWPIDMNTVTATVVAPSINRAKCFAGAYGTDSECDSVSKINHVGGVDRVIFAQNALKKYTGLTIVVSMPAGTVYQPSTIEKMMKFMMDNWILAIPIIVFIFMGLLWNRRGRDPKGTGVIVPYYEAPDNLSPAEVGLIIDEKVDARDVSALIINLAIKGCLHIRKNNKKYTFVKMQNADCANLLSEEKMLYDSLFDGNKTEVDVDSLKNSFYGSLAKIKDEVTQKGITKGYYEKNPQTVRAKYITLGFLLFMTSFFVVPFLGFVGAVALFLTALSVIGFGWFMPRRTKKGAIALEQILGLQLYLETAEKDRINFHNAPEKNPERFEKLLPYAMALGVEKAWAKQFEGIYNESPQWYESTEPFAVSTFANDMHSFNNVTSSAMSSQPSSAASGSSGFSSGGGFSGGGFGGGGGGSW
jgi:uncharacterized membrane protein YgcG